MDDLKTRAIDMFGKCYWDRFWSKVDNAFGEETACWLWMASCGPIKDGGHGWFKLNRRMERAHRVAWELLKGPIPEGMVIRHNCPGQDNPRCCNVNHLRLGTQADNVQDCVIKERMHRRIMDADVLYIYARCEGLQKRSKELTDTYKELANRFGVGVHCIREIARKNKRILSNASTKH